MDIDDLISYTPKIHGEHGVDSVIHRSIANNKKLFESYSNPPGGSWARLEIKHNNLNLIFAWDNIPRIISGAKRPDSIIQYNDNNIINFMIMESKEKISQIYDDISCLLKNFLKGSKNFEGIINRPTQMCMNDDGIWEFIEYGAANSSWLQNMKKYINLYSGFSFAFEPEHYDNQNSIDKQLWMNKIKCIREKYDLDLIIGVGWMGKHHIPFMLIDCDKKFVETTFYNEICATFNNLII